MRVNGVFFCMSVAIQQLEINPAKYFDQMYSYYNNLYHLVTYVYINISVADPGCLSRIPDPDFYSSRIPDFGSRIPDPKTATKDRGENFFWSNHFL